MPLFTLFLNPFAGSGFNLTSVIFYALVTILALCWMVERINNGGK